MLNFNKLIMTDLPIASHSGLYKIMNDINIILATYTILEVHPAYNGFVHVRLFIEWSTQITDHLVALWW